MRHAIVMLLSILQKCLRHSKKRITFITTKTIYLAGKRNACHTRNRLSACLLYLRNACILYVYTWSDRKTSAAQYSIICSSCVSLPLSISRHFLLHCYWIEEYVTDFTSAGQGLSSAGVFYWSNLSHDLGGEYWLVVPKCSGTTVAAIIKMRVTCAEIDEMSRR